MGQGTFLGIGLLLLGLALLRAVVVRRSGAGDGSGFAPQLRAVIVASVLLTIVLVVVIVLDASHH
jgi:hypothetical protein